MLRLVGERAPALFVPKTDASHALRHALASFVAAPASADRGVAIATRVHAYRTLQRVVELNRESPVKARGLGVMFHAKYDCVASVFRTSPLPSLDDVDQLARFQGIVDRELRRPHNDGGDAYQNVVHEFLSDKNDADYFLDFESDVFDRVMSDSLEFEQLKNMFCAANAFTHLRVVEELRPDIIRLTSTPTRVHMFLERHGVFLGAVGGCLALQRVLS